MMTTMTMMSRNTVPNAVEDCTLELTCRSWPPQAWLMLSTNIAGQVLQYKGVVYFKPCETFPRSKCPRLPHEPQKKTQAAKRTPGKRNTPFRARIRGWTRFGRHQEKNKKQSTDFEGAEAKERVVSCRNCLNCQVLLHLQGPKTENVAK